MPITVVSTTAITGAKAVTSITSGNISVQTDDILVVVSSVVAGTISVTDNQTRSWTTANTTGTPNIAYSYAICTTTTTTQTVTVNSTSSTAIGGVVYLLRGATTSGFVSDTATSGSSTAPTITSSSVANGYIVLSWLGVNGPTGDTFTADADTTNGSWSANTTSGTTGGGATTNVSVRTQSKIVTATGTQTYNPTLGTSRAWVADDVIFVAAGATTGSGSISISGSANAALDFPNRTGSGSISLDGTATGTLSSSTTGSADISLTGTAVGSIGTSGSASIDLSASANATLVFATTGSGSIILTGILLQGTPATGSASITLSGLASISFAPAPATYRYLFADLLTNEIIAELPLTGVSFTQQLNQAGSFQGHILLGGLNSEYYNVLPATIPGRNAIYVDRSGVIVWGGVIWGRDYSSADQTLSIQAREFESYLERRRINTTIAFNNTDQLSIAQTLVNQMQAQTNGDIGIQIVPASSGILLDRTYYDYELKTYYNALQDLSRAEDGFDFNILCAYGGSGVTKTLNLGYPRLGVVYSSTNIQATVFDFPGNIVEYLYPEDGSIAANKVYALGAGSNEGKLVSIQTDPTKLTTGWPLLEEQANYSDVTDQTYLDQLAEGQVNAVSYPPTVLRIVVPAYVTPIFGTYSIGDDARVMITDVFFPDTLDEVYRIVGLSIEPGEDGPERVTLTLTTTTN